MVFWTDPACLEPLFKTFPFLPSAKVGEDIAYENFPAPIDENIKFLSNSLRDNTIK
jgi:hypothetical protein